MATSTRRVKIEYSMAVYMSSIVFFMNYMLVSRIISLSAANFEWSNSPMTSRLASHRLRLQQEPKLVASLVVVRGFAPHLFEVFTRQRIVGVDRQGSL